MKHFFYASTLLLWLMPWKAFAQIAPQFATCNQCNGNNPTYNAIQTYITSDISSDYGMRVANGGTRFHQGIDYVKPAGTAIVSLTAGRVTLLTGTGNGLKKIVIDGNFDEDGTNIPGGHIFSYLHIFNGDDPPSNSSSNSQVAGIRSGGFVLLRIPGHNSEAAIVNMTTTPYTAISMVPGRVFTYNAQICTTTNFVQAGQLIAPIGNSGAEEVHLHLSHMEQGTADRHITHSIDPWNQVNHNDNALDTRMRRRNSTGFALSVCEYNIDANSWGTFVPNYSDETRNILEMEVSMPNASIPAGQPDRYSNVVMNESSLAWQLKNQSAGDDFREILGLNYKSTYTIDPVGTTSIYPPEMWDRPLTPGRYGGVNLNQNGCAPFAYRSNGNGGFAMAPQHPTGSGHPHDYYLFPDFYLRIHTDHLEDAELKLANYPWDARYVDSDYSIRSQVTNIDGDPYPSPEIMFDIDNFKPLVTEVGVFFGSTQAYYRGWEELKESESSMKLGVVVEKKVSDLGAPGDLEVIAHTSERMSEMSVIIPTLWANEIPGTEILTGEGKKWKFIFGNDYTKPLVVGACHKILLKGKDKNGNEVLDIPVTITDCNKVTNGTCIIPKRTGASSWDNGTPTGKDEIHRFKIKPCTAPQREVAENIDCITEDDYSINIKYASGNQANGSIKIKLNVVLPDIEIKWYNSNGDQIGFGPNLLNKAPGWYCYEIGTCECSISDCIEIKACDTNFEMQGDVTYTQPNEATGSISLSVTGGYPPYTYDWDYSAGGDEPILTNLPMDYYCAEVVDAFGCSIADCYMVETCGEVKFGSVNLLSENPTGCDLNDGWIKVLSVTVTPSGPTYTYSVVDDQGNQYFANAFATYENLPPGNYRLRAEDENGCFALSTEMVTLQFSHFPILVEEVLPNCVGSSVGSVLVFAIDPEIGNYDFYWSTGDVTYNDIESSIADLPTGVYNVTISSTEAECILVREYVVTEISPQSPLQASGVVLHPCPNALNGKITTFVSGGIPPYKYEWSDNNSGAGIRNNLSAGVFRVTITDYCGERVTDEFNLMPISVEVTTTPGCEGHGSATAVASGGNPGYTYQWHGSGSGALPTLEQMSSGEQYNITVKDIRGCTATEYVFIANKSMNLLYDPPCSGMSDGSITVEVICPPNGGQVTVELNGVVEFNGVTTGATHNVQIGNLTAGLDCTFKVTIDDCIYEQASTTRSKPITRVYSGYEEGRCQYDDYCDGVLLAGGGSSSEPYLELPADWENGYFKCKLAEMCNGEEVGTKSISLIRARAGAYREILNWAYCCYPTDLVDSRIIYYDANYASKPCKFILYCPATLELHRDFVAGGLLSFGDDGTVINLGGGVYDLECGPLGIINAGFYLPNIVPDFITDDIGPASVEYAGCNPATYKLYQLILWEQSLLLMPGFSASDLFTQYIDLYREDPRAKCIDITFCRSNFDVKHTNPISIDLVDCGDTFIDCNSWGNPTSEGYQKFCCVDPNSFNEITIYGPNGVTILNGYCYYANPNFSGTLLVGEEAEKSQKIEITHLTQSRDDDLSFAAWLYPNPTNSNINVSIETEIDQSIWIEIFDSQGVSIFKKSYFAENGSPIIENFLSSNLFGIYFVRITDSKGDYVSSKIIKI